MKRSTLFILSLGLVFYAEANHITGGEIFYKLKSQSGNNYTYTVTLKLYRDHFSNGAPLDDDASIAIFDRLTGKMVWPKDNPPTPVHRSFIEFLDLISPGPCINKPPTVFYDVGHYQFEVTL